MRNDADDEPYCFSTGDHAAAEWRTIADDWSAVGSGG